MTLEFQVHVEGANGEAECYYCRKQPTLVRKPVLDSEVEETRLFVKFWAENGLASRVGRPNYVPINRLLAIVEPPVEEEDA